MLTPWNTPRFLHHRGVGTPRSLHNQGVSTPRCLHHGSQYSLVLAPPGSQYSQVLAPAGSHFAYFPEFQIIKTALKGTIIQTLLYLLNYLPHEMKFLF